MEAITVSALTELLLNILLGCFSLAILTWMAVGIQTFFNDRKDEKRRKKKEAQDDEYHQERMKALK